MKQPIEWKRMIGFGVLGLLLAIPLVVPLSALPLVVCDETRTGLNSIEMLLNRNFLVTTALGEPERWNTKPILLNWLQALSMQLFGISLPALRLPSVLAAVGTCGLLIHAGKRLFGAERVGWLAAFILVSSAGYCQVHVAWTGDYEATLTLFTTGYVLSFFYWLTTKSALWGWTFWLSVTAASLTKGVAALFFFPALLVFWVFGARQTSFWWLLRNPVTYLGGIFFLVGVGAYYGIREWHDPGYLSAVVSNELGQRFSHQLEALPIPWYYYLSLLIASWFKYTSPVIAWGFVTGWKNLKYRLPVEYLVLVASGYLAVISLSQTKWYWYAAPMLPLIALLGGYGVHQIFGAFADGKKRGLSNRVGVVFMVGWLLVLPYAQTLHRAGEVARYYAQEKPEEFSAFLHNAARQHASLKGLAVLTPLGANLSQLAFYQALFRERGGAFQLQYVDQLSNCPSQLIVGASQQNWVEKTFICSVVDSVAGVKRYRIYSEKGATLRADSLGKFPVD